MMSDDDNDGQMIFGDLGGLKLPDICLTGEEKPHPGNLPRPGIEPGPTACIISTSYQLIEKINMGMKCVIPTLKHNKSCFHGVLIVGLHFFSFQ